MKIRTYDESENESLDNEEPDGEEFNEDKSENEDTSESESQEISMGMCKIVALLQNQT